MVRRAQQSAVQKSVRQAMRAGDLLGHLRVDADLGCDASPTGNHFADLREDGLGAAALEPRDARDGAYLLDGERVALAVDGHLVAVEPDAGGLPRPDHV